ncbi:MAG: YdcF family protein [Gammaproteobacteria bacterium]|nr:YdcF family protein [Gammaproteobacteria bacterium]
MIRSLLTQLALPPALNFVLLLLGLLLMLRYRRLGQGVAAFALVTLLLLSLPWVKYQVHVALEVYPPVEPARLQALDANSSAIVVLGGGLRGFAPEYSHEGLADNTLRRVLYAVEVASQRPLPVLVSGGGPQDSDDTEAALMAQMLGRMNLAPRWQEDRSRNTWENAEFSAALLRQAGIDTVVLVTDAWHMRRAVPCFEAQGMKVVPAPTGFRSGTYPDLRTLVPERTALFQNGDALREWLGVLAYALSYDSFRNAAFPSSESAISESTISGTMAVPAAAAPDQSPSPSR